MPTRERIPFKNHSSHQQRYENKRNYNRVLKGISGGASYCLRHKNYCSFIGGEGQCSKIITENIAGLFLEN